MKSLRIALLLTVLAVSLLCSACNNGASAVAEIKKPKGIVEARFTTDARFAAAGEGTPLAIGGAAKTGEDSTSLVVIAGKAEIALKPESFFEVGLGNTLGKQTAGTAIYNVEKHPQSLRIETPHGVTAVLGTRFLIEVNASGTIILVDEGKVSFTNPVGNSREINPRERLIAPVSGPLPAPEKIDPITCEQIFRPMPGAQPGFNQR
jgi:hypothetical protein